MCVHVLSIRFLESVGTPPMNNLRIVLFCFTAMVDYCLCPQPWTIFQPQMNDYGLQYKLYYQCFIDRLCIVMNLRFWHHFPLDLRFSWLTWPPSQSLALASTPLGVLGLLLSTTRPRLGMTMLVHFPQTTDYLNYY